MLLFAGTTASAQQIFYSIPKQELNLYKMIGNENKKSIQTIKEFEISKQVTLKEYKEYLAAIKKDSSEAFYRTQLPDTSIGTKAVREKYLNEKQYEDFPVLGISWDNAMNYCKWKTIKENKDSIRIIYRLPHCSEWLSAHYYLENTKQKHDLNKNYSDWTLATYDESFFLFNKANEPINFFFDHFYFHSSNDARVLKRKRVMGNNFFYQQDKKFMDFASFYANDGYKYIGFRCVKEQVKSVPKELNDKSLSTSLLNYWGIKRK
ncbi:MAG: SUMF1/EgtB/PvdO family nonheme iron enzyme [Bacteroidia bacterium]|nr:SUMF1/EgtB/PvdO family nonheme iron enzyme [Bacteroidia bacterium]